VVCFQRKEFAEGARVRFRIPGPPQKPQRMVPAVFILRCQRQSDRLQNSRLPV
jgi:hypothetical protein